MCPRLRRRVTRHACLCALAAAWLLLNFPSDLCPYIHYVAIHQRGRLLRTVQKPTQSLALCVSQNIINGSPIRISISVLARSVYSVGFNCQHCCTISAGGRPKCNRIESVLSLHKMHTRCEQQLCINVPACVRACAWIARRYYVLNRAHGTG